MGDDGRGEGAEAEAEAEAAAAAGRSSSGARAFVCASTAIPRTLDVLCTLPTTMIGSETAATRPRPASPPPPRHHPSPQDDDAKVKEAGARVGATMCRALLDAGVHGLHFYTLNLEKVTYAILRELGIFHEIEGEAALD